MSSDVVTEERRYEARHLRADDNDSGQFTTLTTVHAASLIHQRPQEFTSMPASLRENVRSRRPRGRCSRQRLSVPAAPFLTKLR